MPGHRGVVLKRSDAVEMTASLSLSAALSAKRQAQNRAITCHVCVPPRNSKTPRRACPMNGWGPLPRTFFPGSFWISMELGGVVYGFSVFMIALISHRFEEPRDHLLPDKGINVAGSLHLCERHPDIGGVAGGVLKHRRWEDNVFSSGSSILQSSALQFGHAGRCQVDFGARFMVLNSACQRLDAGRTCSCARLSDVSVSEHIYAVHTVAQRTFKLVRAALRARDRPVSRGQHSPLSAILLHSASLRPRRATPSPKFAKHFPGDFSALFPRRGITLIGRKCILHLGQPFKHTLMNILEIQSPGNWYRSIQICHVQTLLTPP